MQQIRKFPCIDLKNLKNHILGMEKKRRKIRKIMSANFG